MTAASIPNKRLLAGMAAGVLVTAADTYLVVILLPSMMLTYGISLSSLERAAPLVSGFLLGYVVTQPLVGKLSDEFGRGPFLAAALLTFAIGSLVTASSGTLLAATVGRTIQGCGGGALLPLTFATIADAYQEEKRAVPLALVGAVQEVGSLAGPLVGALILQIATWEAAFSVNAAVIAGIGAVIHARKGVRLGTSSLALLALLLLAVPLFSGSPSGGTAVSLAAGILVAVTGAVAASRRGLSLPSRIEQGGLGIACAGTALALTAPTSETSSYWPVFSPVLAGLSPLWIAVVVAAAFALGASLAEEKHREALARGARAADLPALLLFAIIAALLIIPFTTVSPGKEALPSSTPWIALAIVVAAGLFVIRERSARSPLIPLSDFSSRASWGSLGATFLAGLSLVAVVLDVPIEVRTVVPGATQAAAAFELLRFLVGTAAGALLGGYATRKFGGRRAAACALVLAAAGLAGIASWQAGSLAGQSILGLRVSDLELVAAGLGIGGTVAPLASTMLGAIPRTRHGLGSSLLVVSRMLGMIVGVSVLTSVGLYVFTRAAEKIPSPFSLCPASPGNCGPYDLRVTGALVSEMHAIFLLAAASSLLAALLAAALLPGSRTRGKDR